jgi:choline kinase
MRAIILAAGVGRRLGGSVTDHPKSLLQLEGRTVLARMLDALEAVGVRDVVVVVGHLREQIEAAVSDRPNVRTVYNPDYRKGAILSLWSARDAFDDDLLIMDADVLFPTAMLRRLVESPHPDCFLMDTRSRDDGEAMMLMARDGRVLDIARGVRGDYDARGESVGFLKVSAETGRVLLQLLEQAVRAGRDGVEHEEVYPALMQARTIGYEPVEPFAWTEIDFPEDVEQALVLLRSGAIES